MKLPKVFVIDDSPSVCFAIERMLTPFGYDITTEKSGRAALARLPGEAPDVIICDLILPDVDELEICHFIRDHPTLDTAAVILISGVIDQQIAEEARNLGVQQVLKKPFRGDDLAQSVAAVVATGRDATSTPSGGEPISVDQVQELDRLLDQLSTRIKLRIGCIVDAAGGAVANHGEESLNAKELEKLLSIAQLASAVLQETDHGTAEVLTLQARGGVFLLYLLANGYLVIVSPDDRHIFGKARYLLTHFAKMMSVVIASHE